MHTLQGMLWTTRKKAPPAVRCRTDLVTSTAVRVRVPRDLGRPGGHFKRPADGKLNARFLKRYGAELRLRLTTGVRDAWSGPVRVCTVEGCDDEPTSFCVTLAFCTPLTTAELTLLDLHACAPAREAAPSAAAPTPSTAGAVTAVMPACPPQATERRRATRVEIEVPAQILTTQGFVAAVVKDLSRTGLRVMVKGRHVGCEGGRDMASIAAGVKVALSPRFPIQLHHKMLGSLLSRDVHMTRLAIPPGAAGDVEFGGYFDEPLSSEETMVLGIPLPPVAASDEAWCPRADQPAPHYRVKAAGRAVAQADNAGDTEQDPPPRSRDGCESSDTLLDDPQPRTWRAYVRGRGVESATVVACQADQAATNGLRLRLDRALACPQEGAGVAAVSQRFVEIFGNQVSVKILDERGQVWSGPLTVCAVELPRDSEDEILVTLLFGTRLRASERGRLGLSLTAA